MTAEPLRRVLEGTGYLFDGEPAPGVQIRPSMHRYAPNRALRPDASWQGSSGLRVYFKYAPDAPDALTVSSWHREVWNEGFAPLLWVVSPHRVQLYNGFGRPRSATDAEAHLIRVFEGIDQHLSELDAFAGRLAMETGQFWSHSNQVTRETGVDEQLLSDLAALERDLLDLIPRQEAQALIGRAIFTQYLVDRRILGSQRLTDVCGESRFTSALREPEAARKLFEWLATVFNGDMFPLTDRVDDAPPQALSRLADFLEAVDPDTGQTTFFPYEFDVIPVELISSIYEQFAHTGDEPDVDSGSSKGEARLRAVHYTRLPVVSLVLDEVLQNANGDETVLDLTCGSGVFLVEALRRLVRRRAGNSPSREVVRKVLHEQIFGVDISESAVRVAAFSLYLAALELDPDPQPPEALRFEHLIGRTLFVADAASIGGGGRGTPLTERSGNRRAFDVIVGNPPWTYRGKKGTAERRQREETGDSQQPRGEAFDFLLLARRFAHSSTRFGMVLSAPPFFSGSNTGVEAARAALDGLTPVTLVHLGSLTKWLFATATMPAMILLARHHQGSADHLTAVDVPWSPLAEKSYTFAIAPSDVSTLRRSDWAADPDRLKATIFGRGRDRAVLEALRNEHAELGSWLRSVGAEWRDGLILGTRSNRTRDASLLQGLPFLEARDLRNFRVPAELPEFTHPAAQWPRDREIYRAPILLIKEFFRGGPRPIAAVARRDLVYTDAFFGASLPEDELDSARLLSTILSSALGAWFFLLTASEFGVWKRRLLTADVGALPVVNPRNALTTEAGRRLLTLEQHLGGSSITSAHWDELDEAVFDLYSFSWSERLVIRDGLTRASWQWKAGRESSMAGADVEPDLKPYAAAFTGAIDQWLQATGRRHVTAEIFDLPQHSPLRVIRFYLDQGGRRPEVTVAPTEGQLGDVLRRIGDRLGVRVGSTMLAERELRIHGADEVVIIKPNARRFWLPAVGLSDADAVVRESFSGAPA